MKSATNEEQVQLRVNGAEHSVAAPAGRLLLDVLRDDLDLTGTKRGCDDGTCGTCMITVNGAMARACRMDAQHAGGKDVVTIEGLGTPERLHPLQQAFIEADAVQCGFCTPGAIMAAKALLDRNPSPTRPQIARALGSNLCRCTGYLGILEAVERVARGESGPGMPLLPGSQPRPDALAKVLGTAVYAADLKMTGMLHGAILRSPHAHAEIVAIDTTAARAVPGVAAVVTGADVPGTNRYGRAVKDQRVLADGRVRQIGDAVAAVAATTPEAAARALALIRVEYRELPAITDPAAALSAEAPLIHDSGNLLDSKTIAWGDAEAALARAEVVVDETFTTPFCEHAYLEPEAVLAYLDGDGRLTVRSPNQYPALHRRSVAETMNLPLAQVRILPTVVGGAFGAKTDVSCECVAALLVVKTQRPVRIVYTRAESFVSTTKRHPFRIRCRIGATREGRLTALAADVLADTGAYASAGPNVLVRGLVSLVGPYAFPNVALAGRVVYTNNPVAGAMRGFGAPQTAFALESQLDVLATRLGLDPLELRRLNARNTPPGGTTARDVEQESAYRATIEAVRPYYEEARRARDAAPGNGRLRRGVGIASMRYGIGYASANPPRTTLALESDGRVRLYTGATDMGQGTEAAIGLIISEELGVPRERVIFTSGDTDVTPDTGTSAGSRVIYTEGNAAKEAAARLREAVLRTAAELIGLTYEKLEVRNGMVAPRAETGLAAPAVSLQEVARARRAAGQPLSFEGVFRAEPMRRDALSGGAAPYLVHVTATHVAEVEVDMDNGKVRVLRVVAAHDVGRVIHAQGLKGQIEGAVSMGLGFALKEEFVPGRTEGFEEYRIPTARDMPEIVTLPVEMIDPSAPLGAKGVAECATVPVAPAIANAIANATGARIRELPATPPRLLGLLRSARAA